MESRIMKGRLLLLKIVMEGRNYFLAEVVMEMNAEAKNKWQNKNVRETLKITDANLLTLKERDIKKKIKYCDLQIWKEEVGEKSSLEVYRNWRNNIGMQDEVYENSPLSIILYKCRSNTLQLNNRKKFQDESTTWIMCTTENEDLRHFLLKCPGYSQERQELKALHQPYIEDEQEIIGKLFFDNKYLEK